MATIPNDSNLEPANGAPANWQKAVMERYPKIGVAGSKENLAFVAEYKKSGSPETAMMFAETLEGFDWDPIKGAIIKPFDMSKLSEGDRARYEIESTRASWGDE